MLFLPPYYYFFSYYFSPSHLSKLHSSEAKTLWSYGRSSGSKEQVLVIESSQNGLGWKGPQGSWISNPPARQGDQPPHLLDQVAQGAIQPGLEHLQGWGIHSQSGQLFQPLTTLPPISMGFYFSILRGDTSSFLLSLRTFQNKATLSTHAHCSQEDCVTWFNTYLFSGPAFQNALCITTLLYSPTISYTTSIPRVHKRNMGQAKMFFAPLS